MPKALLPAIAVRGLKTIRNAAKIRENERSEEKKAFTYDDVITQVECETDFNQFQTPSHVYVSLLKRAMQKGVSLEHLHLSDVLISLRRRGVVIDSESGKLVRESRIAYGTPRDARKSRMDSS